MNGLSSNSLQKKKIIQDLVTASLYPSTSEHLHLTLSNAALHVSKHFILQPVLICWAQLVKLRHEEVKRHCRGSHIAGLDRRGAPDYLFGPLSKATSSLRSMETYFSKFHQKRLNLNLGRWENPVSLNFLLPTLGLVPEAPGPQAGPTTRSWNKLTCEGQYFSFFSFLFFTLVIYNKIYFIMFAFSNDLVTFFFPQDAEELHQNCKNLQTHLNC